MNDPLGFTSHRPISLTNIASAHKIRPVEVKKYTGNYGGESQESIEQCLNCTIPAAKCRGIGWCSKRKENGSQQEPESIGRPPKKKKEYPIPEKDPCIKCRTYMLCRERGINCGEKRRYERSKEL